MEGLASRRAGTAGLDLQLGVVFDQLLDYVFVLREEGEHFRCLDVNQAILNLARSGRETFVGKLVHEIPPVPAARRLAEQYHEAVRTWAPVCFEDSLDTPAGRFYAEITVTPFVSDRGERCLLGVGRDVTKRRLAEESLRQSYDRLSEVLESISDGFYVLDADWRFTYVNDQAEKLLHTSRHDLLGRRATDVFPESLDTEVPSYYLQAFESGEPVEFTGYYPPPLDTWYVIRAYPGPHGLSVYFRDDSERRRVDDQLRQAAKMQAVGQLAGGIAHDFNNLLSSIQGYGELALARMEPHDPAADAVAQVLVAGRRAADLVQQLMTFSRDQIRRVRVVAAADVVERAMRLVQPLLGSSVRLAIDLSAGVPPIETDPVQLEQALVNLAVNARDALLDGGTVRIAIDSVDADDPAAPPAPAARPDSGRWVLLTVEDDGIGMDAATAARAFEPFFTTKEPGRGTGLGLAAVYAVVTQAGGVVDLDSRPGLGTRLRIWLPGSTRAVDAEEPSPEAWGRAAHAPAGTRVLLVEDDGAVRELITQVLAERGYEVEPAADADEALRKAARSGGVTALVSDVVMPGMSGPVLAERLRERWPDLRVLLISGHARDRLSDDVRTAPGTAFLQKPFRLDELAETLRGLIES